MRTRSWVGLSLAVAAGLAAPWLSPSSSSTLAPSALAEPRAALPTGKVAVVATSPRSGLSSLYLIGTNDATTPAPVAIWNHSEDAAVRASVLGDGETVVAIADTLEVRDLSFAASLFLVRPHAPPTAMVDRVVHASRPLVTREGRLFVARGEPGAPSDERGALRVDALTIDEIDPATSAARTIHSFAGFLTFLAGSIDDDLIVYRVNASGADLVRVGASSGEVRSLVASMPPFARDFSVDRATRALFFTERDVGQKVWTIERVGLDDGARTRLVEDASMSLAPHAWADGTLAWNPAGEAGLAWLELVVGARAKPLVRPSSPLGAGVDLIQADAEGARLVAGVHMPLDGGLPTAFALDTTTFAARALPSPPGARVTVAGFVKASVQ